MDNETERINNEAKRANNNIGGFGLDVKKISRIYEFATREEKHDEKTRVLYFCGDENGKVFLVLNKNTLEVRTDAELKKLLTQKYESVMESRYFGRGGVEIVLAGQLSTEELEDLIRLSYTMSR